MLKTLEGIVHNGRIELTEPAYMAEGTPVKVTFEIPQNAMRIMSGPHRPPVPTPEEWQQRTDQLGELLQEWMADESGYDEDVWPKLKSSLEENRAESGDFGRLFGE